MLLPSRHALPAELCMPVSWPHVLTNYVDTFVLTSGGTGGSCCPSRLCRDWGRSYLLLPDP